MKFELNVNTLTSKEKTQLSNKLKIDLLLNKLGILYPLLNKLRVHQMSNITRIVPTTYYFKREQCQRNLMSIFKISNKLIRSKKLLILRTRMKSSANCKRRFKYNNNKIWNWRHRTLLSSKNRFLLTSFLVFSSKTKQLVVTLWLHQK